MSSWATLSNALLKSRRIRSVFLPICIFLDRWRSGAVVRALDFGPRGPWFEPRPVHISLWP